MTWPETEGENLCWCNPDVDNLGTVLHHSMDGKLN